MNISANKINIRKTSTYCSSKRNSVKKSPRKRFNNNSVIFMNSSKMKTDMTKKEKSFVDYDKISFLSNANLNVIKILNNCANDSLINKSSFIEDTKEKSVLSISKRKRNKSKLKKINEKRLKREKSISNKNTNKYYLNKSHNDLEIDNKDKFKYSTIIGYDPYNSTNLSNKKINEKVRLSSKKNLINHNRKFKFDSCKNLKSKTKSKRMSILSPIKHKKTNKLRPRSRSILFPNNTIDINHSSISNKEEGFYVNRKKYQSNKSILGFVDDNNIKQMNENIDPEVSLILLKKRISQLKKTIRMRVSNKDLGKHSKINEISDFKYKSTEKGSEKSISKYKSNLIKKTSTKKIIVNNDNNKEVDRYRILTRKNYLYDSFDDEEERDELMDCYISPNSIYIKIFDILLFLSSLFYLTYVPYLIFYHLIIIYRCN